MERVDWSEQITYRGEYFSSRRQTEKGRACTQNRRRKSTEKSVASRKGRQTKVRTSEPQLGRLLEARPE